MTAMLTAAPPRCRDVPGAATPWPARLSRVRLRLHELAIQAGLGADSLQIAPQLRELFQRELMSCPAAGRAERLGTGAAFVHGVCKLVRWFDPTRSVQAVPPLCVSVWHVGRSFDTREPSTLWIDFLLPDDTRRMAAAEWANDIRLLLMQADIPHRSERVLVPPRVNAEQPGLHDAGAWGCMSLWQAYRYGGDLVRGIP